MQTLFFNELDSTNIEATRRWRAADQSSPIPPLPFAVVAARQVAGMGRAGRSWKSPVGGLWLSVAWPLRLSAEAYAPAPLAVGLAATEALQDCCSVNCAIKWPNDLLVNDKKLAGVLCQCELGAAYPVLIAGVGINGNFSATILGGDLRQPATSIYDEIGQPVDLQALQISLIKNIRQNLEYLEEGRFASLLLPRIRQRLAWRNQPVIFGHDSRGRFLEGQLVDVTETGHAVLVTNAGRQTVFSGELRLRAANVMDEGN
ncbi:MAG: biotin--[acetyl-CoA-carboxylase] ligase [Phycisphaerae bacterium]